MTAVRRAFMHYGACKARLYVVVRPRRTTSGRVLCRCTTGWKGRSDVGEVTSEKCCRLVMAVGDGWRLGFLHRCTVAPLLHRCELTAAKLSCFLWDLFLVTKFRPQLLTAQQFPCVNFASNSDETMSEVLIDKRNHKCLPRVLFPPQVPTGRVLFPPQVPTGPSRCVPQPSAGTCTGRWLAPLGGLSLIHI